MLLGVTLMAKKKRGKAKASRRKVRTGKKKRATSKKKVSKRKSAAKKKSAVKRKAAKAKKKAVTKKAVVKKTTAGKFNMLVTYDPNHRGLAETELKEVFKQAGELPKIMATEVEGLFKVAVKDARAAAKKITKLVQANPAVFATTHHYTPVDSWTKSDVNSMQQAVKKAADGIGNDEKWKMGLNKRHWDKMESTPLIIKLTEVVEKPNVDLSNPEKILQVEIIGGEAGIALLTPEELVDVPRLKTGQ
jgi:tRNA(Ser,Leu) C12 N-acetylase TAN1